MPKLPVIDLAHINTWGTKTLIYPSCLENAIPNYKEFGVIRIPLKRDCISGRYGILLEFIII